ncbi:MAG: DUF4143 domain-containing protein, partial [Elusimicrobiota bacterium]|nr:DUF4143 domain-containing protein [Elusimicrobiota bacterium]
DFELAIQWLADAGILYKIPRVNSLKSPLKHYEDLSAFKIFLVDVGLLSAMSNVEPRIVLEKNDIFVEYKGAMTEQYVAQQLIAGKNKLYYFSSDNAKSEVDFLIERDGAAVPVEVKSAENLASKSLRFIIEKYNIAKAVKFSILTEKRNKTTYNLPLYLAANLNEFL